MPDDRHQAVCALLAKTLAAPELGDQGTNCLMAKQDYGKNRWV